MDTRVSIKLPLPLDIIQTLGRVLGSVYPSTKMATDAQPGSLGQELVYWVSSEDRAASLDTDDPEVVAVPSAGDVEALLTSVRDGSLGFSVPEYFTLMMGEMVGDILADDSIDNYIEMGVVKEGKRYSIIAARSEGQTPHALRQAAEEALLAEKARTRVLKAKLEELGVDVSTLI